MNIEKQNCEIRNSSSLLDLRLSKKNEGGNVLIAITMQHKTQSQLLNSLYTTPILVRGWAILVNISGGKMGPRGTESIRERRMFSHYFIVCSTYICCKSKCG